MKLIDYQLHSNVARLLSRENITVVHGKVPTASFDLKNRVMKLPIWEDFGKVVYDMLVAHECSHAVFDDFPLIDEYFKDNGFSSVPDALNVIDDIRIERKIQDKYPGLTKIFRAAYKTLAEEDLFKVKGKDISKLGFVDRLNLHAKIGFVLDVPLSDEEREFYNRCYASDTTQDVIDLFEEFRDLDQTSQQEQSSSDSAEQEQSASEEQEQSASEEQEQSDSGESGQDEGQEETYQSLEDLSSDSEEENDVSKGISSDEDSETVDQTSEEDNGSAGKMGSLVDSVSETQKEFESNISKPIESSFDYGLDIPTVFPRKSSVRKVTNSYQRVIKQRNEFTGFKAWASESNSQQSYLEYTKNVKKKVAVLIREFERRKAAFRYSRSSESRIGTIDVNNLHKYRYDDQIFNTVTRLADGKNHGMIFYIDYSYSMQKVLRDVIDQTLNLVYFCRKLSIPFEVYSYTTGRHTGPAICDDYEINLDDVVINNIMSSSMSKKDYEIGFQQLYYQYESLDFNALSPLEMLGGTPLNAVIMSANHHCDDFQKKNRVDKLNVIILSDGDSHKAASRYRTSGISIFEGKKIDISFSRTYEFVQNTRTVRDNQQESALEILRRKANVIGMFLPTSKKDVKRKLALAGESSFKKLEKRYKKDSSISIPDCVGYDSLILLSSNLSVSEEEFEYSTDENISESRAAQNKLAKEFSRVNSKNKKSRVLLTNFAQLIA